MCRSLAESGRRCPCSLPHRRSAADRARYAARKAASLTSAKPVHSSVLSDLERPAVPTVEQVREVANLAGAIYDDTSTTGIEGRDQARARLSEFANTREALVRQVGSQIATRAELHAGITADEAHESWKQRSADALANYERIRGECDAKRDELRVDALRQEEADTDVAYHIARVRGADDATIEELRAAHSAAYKDYRSARDQHDEYVHEHGVEDARTAYVNIERGYDPVSREHLQRLSDGYSKAIAEVRATGGAMRWNGKSTKRATELFDRAAQVYPSDWVDASNLRPAPIAKTSTGRAHYSEFKIHTSKKRVAVTIIEITDSDFEPPNDENRTFYDLRYDYVPVEGARERYGERQWTKTTYEVYSEWSHRSRDGKPVGNGWQRITYKDNLGETHETWRRPRTRMQVVSTEAAPELTVSEQFSPLGGPGYEVAVHELAHRMEATVPMISRMEAEFLARRTTTNGERDTPVVYAKSGRDVEVTRPDDFADVYMGKDYRSHVFHEVMSCGMQGLFGGRFGGLVGVGKHKKDDDMRAFILGVLGSARPSVRGA